MPNKVVIGVGTGYEKNTKKKHWNNNNFFL